MPTKGERQFQRGLDTPRLSDERDVVQVTLGVRIGQVSCWRHEAVAQRECGQRQFDAARCVDQVTKHRLERTDTDLVRMTGQGPSNSAGFHHVILLRAGPMRVDVTDFGRIQLAALERIADQSRECFAFQVETGDMVGIGEHFAAKDLGVDLSARAWA